MAGDNLILDGEPLAPEEVTLPRARDLVRRLLLNQHPYATLIACWSGPETEIVIVDVEVEVPQQPVHDIRSRERIALGFDPADARMPAITPLRGDFPTVPHLNITDPGQPKSICLFEEQYREIRPRLTAASLVERVREWLRLTARGELHAADQPLEPLLVGVAGHLIVPHGIVSRREAGEPPPALTVSRRDDLCGRMVLVAEPATTSKDQLLFATTVFWAAPRIHGILTTRPASLEALHLYLQEASDDLLKSLRETFSRWHGTPGILDARLLLIVVAPKTREVGGPTESHDLWAFVTDKNIGQIGVEIGVFQNYQGSAGLLLAIDHSARGKDVRLKLLNVTMTLSREHAAYFNGLAKPGDRQFVCVGAGALGSQVVLNAARTAYGRWTLLDSDIFLPHNAARHGLSADAIGFSKALALSTVANGVLDSDRPPFDFLHVDVLNSQSASEKLNRRFLSADVIVDMSASIPVARYLAREVKSDARRISLFLNPRGTDLVLLCESDDRAIRLDSVEMQYYRALLQQPELERHLDPPPDRIRYGRSCRDVSVRLPQELVALHAAIGTRAIRKVAERDDAQARIWRSNPDTGEVTLHEIAIDRTVTYHVAGWTVVMDEGLLHRLADLRSLKLPRETGGVLLGAFDLDERIVYVVDTIPSPPDSEERPTWFIRGTDGLPGGVTSATDITDGQVEYMGEWHSHPRGHSCHPSEDDARLFAWLAHHMDVLGLPSVMAIAGDDGSLAVFVGTMATGELRDDNRIAVVNGVIDRPQSSC